MDKAQDFEAYFMTSVGSNPIKTKTFFQAFFGLSFQFYDIFGLSLVVLNGLKPNSEFFRPRGANYS